MAWTQTPAASSITTGLDIILFSRSSFHPSGHYQVPFLSQLTPFYAGPFAAASLHPTFVTRPQISTGQEKLPHSMKAHIYQSQRRSQRNRPCILVNINKSTATTLPSLHQSYQQPPPRSLYQSWASFPAAKRAADTTTAIAIAIAIATPATATNSALPHKPLLHTPRGKRAHSQSLS